MRRLFSSLLVGMFAFGFCVGFAGCGEEPAGGGDAPAADAGDEGGSADAGSADAGSDSK